MEVPSGSEIDDELLAREPLIGNRHSHASGGRNGRAGGPAPARRAHAVGGLTQARHDAARLGSTAIWARWTRCGRGPGCRAAWASGSVRELDVALAVAARRGRPWPPPANLPNAPVCMGSPRHAATLAVASRGGSPTSSCSAWPRNARRCARHRRHGPPRRRVDGAGHRTAHTW